MFTTIKIPSQANIGLYNILFKDLPKRYGLSYTIIILAYEKECSCQIFAHSLMVKCEM